MGARPADSKKPNSINFNHKDKTDMGAWDKPKNSSLTRLVVVSPSYKDVSLVLLLYFIEDLLTSFSYGIYFN